MASESAGTYDRPPPAVAAFLTKSKLPKTRLAEVYELATTTFDCGNDDLVPFPAFCAACRLAAHLQINPDLPIHPDLLALLPNSRDFFYSSWINENFPSRENAELELLWFFALAPDPGPGTIPADIVTAFFADLKDPHARTTLTRILGGSGEMTQSRFVHLCKSLRAQLRHKSYNLYNGQSGGGTVASSDQDFAKTRSRITEEPSSLMAVAKSTLDNLSADVQARGRVAAEQVEMLETECSALKDQKENLFGKLIDLVHQTEQRKAILSSLADRKRDYQFEIKELQKEIARLEGFRHQFGTEPLSQEVTELANLPEHDNEP